MNVNFSLNLKNLTLGPTWVYQKELFLQKFGTIIF